MLDFSVSGGTFIINGTPVTHIGREDDYEYMDLVRGLPSGNNCHGTLAIYHGPRRDPLSDLKMRTIAPQNYHRTGRAFRRRRVLKAEVWGNCAWYVYSRPYFRGTRRILNPGFSSQLDFNPKSIYHPENVVESA